MRRLRKLEIALGVIEKFRSDVYTLQGLKNELKHDIEIEESKEREFVEGKSYIYRGKFANPMWEEVEEKEQ